MKKGVEVTEQGYLRAEDPDAPRDLLRCVTASYHKTRADKYEITITLNE